MKHYRVKKDTPLWDEGAILKEISNGIRGGYQPISDVWDATEHNGEEYISAPVIENNPDWFERVYEVNMLKGAVYKVRDEAKKMIGKHYE